MTKAARCATRRLLYAMPVGAAPPLRGPSSWPATRRSPQSSIWWRGTSRRRRRRYVRPCSTAAAACHRPGRASKVGNDRTSELDGRHQVGGDHDLELLVGQVPSRAEDARADVGDHHVDPLQMGFSSPGCCWPLRCRLAGCLFIVSPWPLAAIPARQDCFTGSAGQWLGYPGASRAGPGADRATDRQLAGPSLSAPAPVQPPDPAGLPGSKTSCRGPTQWRSSQLIKPRPALAVAGSVAGIAGCVAPPAMTPSMRAASRGQLPARRSLPAASAGR